MKNCNLLKFKNLKFLAIIGFLFAFTACTTDDDDAGGDDPIVQTDPPIVLDCNYFYEDRILTKNPNAAVDYIVNCIMLVKGDIKVEPGVVIEFEQEAGINVYQDGTDPNVSFSAVGTSSKPIVFRGTTNERGFWTGIRFRAASSTKNELNHVVLQDAGHPYYGENWSGGVMVTAWSPKLKINNTTISNCRNYGLNIDENELVLEFNNNTITNNDTPIKTHPNHLGVLNATSSYNGNTNDFIFINSYGTGISRDLTWNKINVPYKLKADFTAGHGGLGISSNVKIDAGVEIIMTAGSMISVTNNPAGSLAMNGTASDKIIIRGEQNVPGYWLAVRYRSPNPLNKMSHVEIKNGGKTVFNPQSDPNGAVTIDTSFLVMEDVTFNKCFDFGINVRSSNFTYSNLTFIETPRQIGNWHNE